MSQSAVPHEVSEAETDGDLERLLRMERRLSSLLAAAREKADRVVSAAHEEAIEEQTRAARLAAAAEASLERQFAVDHQRQLESIREEAARRVQRLDSVSEQEIDAVAIHILDLILADDGDDS